MDQQIPLFGPPEPLPPNYEIFFVIQPDPATALQIHELATAWRREFGLTGKLRPPEILHVSLHGFGRHAEIPKPLLGKASEACEKTAAATTAFDVQFERILSYQRAGGSPLVLAARKGANAALENFYLRLSAALMMAFGRQLPKPILNPHVSLLYDNQIVPMKPIPPLSWIVNEVALVASELGETKYHYLGRWFFKN